MGTAILNPFKDAINTFKVENGYSWHAKFMRQMALIDPRYRCFLPEQIMPLGNTTPYVLQGAECLVSIVKCGARRDRLSSYTHIPIPCSWQATLR